MLGSDTQFGVKPLPEPVSFASEQLILVDSDDRVIGYDSKRAIHAGAGQLHRAFSVFLFDALGRVLLHRRSEEKPLWPGYWTNSCCSHPRRGESLDAAVRRRLREELGVSGRRVQQIYSFEYHAYFDDRGSEHELCHVYLATCSANDNIVAHAAEIAEWRWFEVAEVDALFADRRAAVTPWFRQEWQALQATHKQSFNAFRRAPGARAAIDAVERLGPPRNVA